jgi:hypothetical protein
MKTRLTYLMSIGRIKAMQSALVDQSASRAVISPHRDQGQRRPKDTRGLAIGGSADIQSIDWIGPDHLWNGLV